MPIHLFYELKSMMTFPMLTPPLRPWGGQRPPPIEAHAVPV